MNQEQLYGNAMLLCTGMESYNGDARAVAPALTSLPGRRSIGITHLCNADGRVNCNACEDITTLSSAVCVRVPMLWTQ